MYDWDTGNVEKTRDLHEVKEVLTDPDRIPETAYHMATEKRRGVLGMTESGRLLSVVYTNRNGRIRVVTAYDASRRQYARYPRRNR